ncbi:MAG TPA: 50S ribosomal protein L9 [Gaiellaceae bacterium]|jgi:large subunit ribosomal protein L9
MEVILLKDVDKVGLRGEVVNVARGFMRNYLEPRRLAEAATPARVAELEKREAQKARHEASTFEQAQEIAAAIGKAELRFDVNAGPQGTLFGSVTPTDIADELWATGKIRVDRRKIGIDSPIKRIGRYSIPIEVFQDVDAEVRVLVVPEGGELPPEEELEAMEAAARAEEEAARAESEPELLEGDEQWTEELLVAEEEAELEEAAPAAEAEAETQAEAEGEAEAEVAEPGAEVAEAAEPAAEAAEPDAEGDSPPS